jgi:rhomboid protease GluP
MRKKILAIYIPFLLLLLGCIISYSLFNWILVIQPLSDSISKELSNYWLPLFFPFLPVFLVFHLLIKPEKPKWASLIWLYLVATVCISPPTILAQLFLEKATGQLTELTNISQIGNSKKSRYYKLKEYYIDKSDFYFTSTCKVVNSGWDLQVFVVSPILCSPADTVLKYPKAWLTKRYYKNIGRLNSSSSHLEKEKAFQEACILDYGQMDVNSFQYLERTPNDLFAAEFTKTVKQSSKFNPDEPATLFDPCYGEIDNRYKSTLFWFILTFLLSNVIFVLMLYLIHKDYQGKR